VSITFAGVPLLLEDPGHEFQTWLERSLSANDMRLWGNEPVGVRAGLQNARGDEAPRIGLCSPNWPTPPRMKLNSLWWPTGATRWARGLFLADRPLLTKIWEAIGGIVADEWPDSGSPQKGTLLIEEDRFYPSAHDIPRKINTEMYLLTPRDCVFGGGTAKGYLLPLVDARYFWQFRDSGDTSGITEWDGLFDWLFYCLGISADAPDSTGFGKPDPLEMLRPYENAATMLDVAAASCGCRVVRDLDGTVRILSSDASRTRRTESWKRTEQVMVTAGDRHDIQRANSVPEIIRVVFPRYVNGVRDTTTRKVWARSVTTDAENAAQETGTVKTFFDSAHALFSTADQSTPDNESDLIDLAESIADAYEDYVGENTSYDLSFAGIYDGWKINGFDDYLWCHYGYQYPIDHCLDGDGYGNAGAIDGEIDINRSILAAGDYAAFTRVASLPPDVGVPMLLHIVESSSSYSSSSSSISSPSSGPSSSPSGPSSSGTGSSSPSSSGTESSSPSSSGTESSSPSSSGTGGSSAGDISSSSSSAATCISCFGESVCIADIPVLTSMAESDYFLVIRNGCLYKIRPTDCATGSSSGSS
jgi:hypothetical protein